MPGHYKKKMNKKKRVNKKPQKGGQVKKKMHCVCSRNHHQMGGRLLSPAQLKLLQRQHPDFRTLPVKTKQRGMGHCGCVQCGGGFFSDLGGALTGAFHDPLRGLAAVATLGASEVVAVPADLLKRTTGVKASKVLDKAAPLISAVAPEAALCSKLTSKGLSMVGLGSRRKMMKKRK